MSNETKKLNNFIVVFYFLFENSIQLCQLEVARWTYFGIFMFSFEDSVVNLIKFQKLWRFQGDLHYFIVFLNFFFRYRLTYLPTDDSFIHLVKKIRTHVSDLTHSCTLYCEITIFGKIWQYKIQVVPNYLQIVN